MDAKKKLSIYCKHLSHEVTHEKQDGAPVRHRVLKLTDISQLVILKLHLYKLLNTFPVPRKSFCWDQSPPFLLLCCLQTSTFSPPALISTASREIAGGSRVRHHLMHLTRHNQSHPSLQFSIPSQKKQSNWVGRNGKSLRKTLSNPSLFIFCWVENNDLLYYFNIITSVFHFISSLNSSIQGGSINQTDKVLHGRFLSSHKHHLHSFYTWEPPLWSKTLQWQGLYKWHTRWSLTIHNSALTHRIAICTFQAWIPEREKAESWRIQISLRV